MPCYHPITAWRAKYPNKNGKRQLVFKKEDAAPCSELQIACGQCWGCRLESSRQWAVRCMHEASLYENNCFITLTYDMDNLPGTGGLVKRDFQLFMKRLRKSTAFKFINPKTGRKNTGYKKIRYFHCGEYGEKRLRPHYHALLFNYDFFDRVPWKETNGIMVYESAELTKIWGKGQATVGELTFDSAAYVARYCMKKINGKMAETLRPDQITKHYERLDPETGELHQVIPEYTTMSLKPGIGHDWIKKYESDVYPSDEMVVNGVITLPPKYYDSKYEHIDEIKTKRIRRAIEKRADNTPERLLVKEKVVKAATQTLKRTI